MKIEGIVYQSEGGHTRRYAELLAKKTGLKAYNVREALMNLPKGGNIIFMGWVRTRDLMGYGLFLKRFTVCAVCMVGAIETSDRLVEWLRKKNRIPAEIPAFYLRGGYDRDAIRGADSRLAGALVEELGKRRKKYEKKGREVPIEEQELLKTLVSGGDYVSPERLEEVLNWYWEVTEEE